MSLSVLLLTFLLCFSSSSFANTSPLDACNKKFMAFSQGAVIDVPSVRDLGDKRSFYFHWGPLDPLIKTRTGTATGTCIIRRDNGQGVVILNKQELGKFSLWD